MKIFRTIQKQYAVLGISASEQLIQKYAVSGKELVGFLLFGCLIISQLIYIFRVANGFMEYIVCICSVSGGIIVFVCFAAIVFEKVTVFACIDSIEKLIDISKRRSYSSTNDWFESLKFHIRMQTPKFGGIFFQGQSTDRTIEWNRFYGNFENCTTTFVAAKMYCQLCHLPHHRFGRRFISIAHPIVVSFYHANAENFRQLLLKCLFFSCSVKGSHLTQIIRLVTWLLLFWNTS